MKNIHHIHKKQTHNYIERTNAVIALVFYKVTQNKLSVRQTQSVICQWHIQFTCSGVKAVHYPSWVLVDIVYEMMTKKNVLLTFFVSVLNRHFIHRGTHHHSKALWYFTLFMYTFVISFMTCYLHLILIQFCASVYNMLHVNSLFVYWCCVVQCIL